MTSSLMCFDRTSMGSDQVSRGPLTHWQALNNKVSHEANMRKGHGIANICDYTKVNGDEATLRHMFLLWNRSRVEAGKSGDVDLQGQSHCSR